jgi:hypothetical protein
METFRFATFEEVAEHQCPRRSQAMLHQVDVGYQRRAVLVNLTPNSTTSDHSQFRQNAQWPIPVVSVMACSRQLP